MPLRARAPALLLAVLLGPPAKAAEPVRIPGGTYLQGTPADAIPGLRERCGVRFPGLRERGAGAAGHGGRLPARPSRGDQRPLRPVRGRAAGVAAGAPRSRDAQRTLPRALERRRTGADGPEAAAEATAEPERRAVHGGSYTGSVVNLRTRWRDSHRVADAREFIGFRCAYPPDR